MSNEISRRQFLKATASIASIAGGISVFHEFAPDALAEQLTPKVELTVTKSDSPISAAIAAVEMLGGIGRFVKPGDFVVIKPNMLRILECTTKSVIVGI